MRLRSRLWLVLPFTASLLVCVGPSAHAAPNAGWMWPVVGPVIRGFEPPSTPFGAGHRGIDIGAPIGTPALAPAPGVVTFAGAVAGHLFVTVDHGGGLASTYSWVSAILVRKGDAVARGWPVALTGAGHPGVEPPHLHFGVRINGAYVDPLQFLSPLSLVGLIRLAPIPSPPLG
jgi:murein DD-endopeptidase MepM/ murein hydrolase activator NlpD